MLINTVVSLEPSRFSNKIFGQLYFAETVQAEQSGEEDDDTEDDSADTLTKNLDLESGDGTLLRYVNILFNIHTCAEFFLGGTFPCIKVVYLYP